MVYIGSDGKVNERKTIWRWSLLRDIFYGIYDFVALFLGAVIHPPAVSNGRGTTSTYAQRHGGRSHRFNQSKPGSNIRGVGSLGTSCAALGKG